MLISTKTRHFLDDDSESDGEIGSVLLSDEAPLSQLKFNKLYTYLKLLLSSWFPLTASSLLYLLPFSINFFFLSGYVDSDIILGSMITAMSWVNCLCLLLLNSINSAMDTVLADFKRNHERVQKAIYYQALLIIGSMFLIPSLGIIYSLGGVINITVEEYDQAYMGLITEFLRNSLPSIVFAFYFEVFRILNISLDFMNFPLILQLMVIFVHFILNLLLLTMSTRLSISEVTWVRNISDFLNLIVVIFAVHPLKIVRKIWDKTYLREAISYIPLFFKKHYKEIVITHTELCKEEIVAIFAFALGSRHELAVFATIYVFKAFCNLASRNLSISFLKTINIAIEHGCTNRAKIISLSVFILSTILSLVEVAGLLLLTRVFQNLFSDNEELLLSIFNDFSALYYPKIFIDNYLCILSGMVRGLAKKRMLMMLYLLGYYGLGLALGFIIYFSQRKRLYDVWLAFVISDALVFTLGLLYIVFLVRWSNRINLLRTLVIKEQTRNL
jgi:Na+-driven multidrug efflux pump